MKEILEDLAVNLFVVFCISVVAFFSLSPADSISKTLHNIARWLRREKKEV